MNTLAYISGRGRRAAHRAAAAALIVALNGGGLAGLGDTVAYFTDGESSGGNAFIAARLDMTLASATDSLVVKPGNDVTLTLAVGTTTGSLPFEYDLKTSATSSSAALCNALLVDAYLGATTSPALYSGPLDALVIGTTTLSASGDVWTLIVSLPDDAPAALSSLLCGFTVTARAWQIGYSAGNAFFDSESDSYTVPSGVWSDPVTSEDANAGISPIQDTHVSAQHPNTVNGGDQALSVRAETGKTERAFVQFEFFLPPGSIVSTSTLLMYLFDAPNESRTYSAHRVAGAWTESTLTWNTQPAIAGAATAATSTGDVNNRWIAWNVTSDVIDFVTGSTTNYGWRVSDAGTETNAARQGQFRSSEHGGTNHEHRPVLEIAFAAPVAITPHVVINEVYYDVNASSGSDANNEWVELYNPTSAAVDISGWEICDGSGTCDTIPAATTPIPAKGFMVVTNSATTWGFWPSIPVVALKLPLGSAIGSGLNDTGDRVTLRDSSSVIVDDMSYGSNTTVFNPSVPIAGNDGKSLARVVKGWDADTREDWIINATPNPGTNPGSDGMEIFRITDSGIEVASAETGLPPLEEGARPEDSSEGKQEEESAPASVLAEAPATAPKEEPVPENEGEETEQVPPADSGDASADDSTENAPADAAQTTSEESAPAARNDQDEEGTLSGEGAAYEPEQQLNPVSLSENAIVPHSEPALPPAPVQEPEIAPAADTPPEAPATEQ